MELYLLNSSYDLESVVDNIYSCLWTERYNSFGDFELVVPLTTDNKTDYTVDRMFANSDTTAIMIVESVEEDTSDDDMGKLIVKGRSMEGAILSKRVIMQQNPSDYGNEWRFEGTPQVILQSMFSYSCGPDANITADKIVGLKTQTNPGVYLGNIPLPTDSTYYVASRKDVYSALTEVAQTYDLGFRLARRDVRGDSGPVFQIYTGNNRTTVQTTYRPIIFSRELGTLVNSKSLVSSADEYNVVYAYSNNEIITLDMTQPSEASNPTHRKVMLYNAGDLQMAPGTAQKTLLTTLATLVLKKARLYAGFDGEIPRSSPYIYGQDYCLGDVVEYQDSYGFSYPVRVSEQIFSLDTNGERSYPTLSADVSFVPGTWSTWDPKQVWPDAIGTWSNY